MDFDEEDDDITLFLLLASGITNLLSILPKLSCQLERVKHWLQCRSTKSVYCNIISELKLQDHYDYWKYFLMNSKNSKTHFVLFFSLFAFWLI